MDMNQENQRLICYYRNNKLIKKESEIVKEAPSKPFIFIMKNEKKIP